MSTGLFDKFASEYDTGESESPGSGDAVERVMNELSEDNIDEEISEAEKRLTKAAYYKVIVRNGVINDDGSDEASEINVEARAWAKKQMALLLNLIPADAPRAPAAELPFNEKEVMVLKKIIERVLSSQGERVIEPTVKKFETPIIPSVKMVQTKRPEPKSVVRTPAPVPKSAPKKVKKDGDGKLDYDSIPSGQVFTDVDGKPKRFVDNPNFDPSKQGSKARAKVSAVKQAGHGALAMPNRAQMAHITAAQAQETVSRAAQANSNFPDEGNVKDAAAMLMAAATKSMIGE